MDFSMNTFKNTPQKRQRDDPTTLTPMKMFEELSEKQRLKRLTAKRSRVIRRRTKLLYLLSNAKLGNVQGVSLYLEKGVNVNGMNDYGNSALHVASIKGHVDVISLLLRSGTSWCSVRGISLQFEEYHLLSHTSNGTLLSEVLFISLTPFLSLSLSLPV